MNILLTNDDGYNALGIKTLKALLNKYGKVVVVAPKTVMSAKSVALNLREPIEVIKESDDLYIVDSTPADCVAYALSSIGIKFDLVVSGINHGHNISYDTMYSGTIGACLQALTYRIPAIAVSAEHNFDLVDKYFDEVMSYIKSHNLLSKEYLLNVNFPLGSEVKGIKDTHIFYRKEVTYYEAKENNTYQALRILKDEKCDDVNSDVYAVHHGYISISKLGKTLDYYE
ncbi:MAG: 5'/3'-nucleotidase SurE [Bacilli bacterium]|nr:5'/3'-nucleotidase SurE [Bacilli bacterium]